MSDVIEAPAKSGPLTALLALGFCVRVVDDQGVVYGTRLGTVGIAASQYEDESWCIKGLAHGVDVAQTAHVTLSNNASPAECKATICSIWKRCSEHSSSIPQALLEQMLEFPSITVDREKLRAALNAPWFNRSETADCKSSPVGLLPIDGQLCIIGPDEHQEFIPIIAGDWPLAFLTDGPADIIGEMIALANPGDTVRLLLTGTGVNVGEWEIGGSIVEK
jgi:hypothetical protein